MLPQRTFFFNPHFINYRKFGGFCSEYTELSLTQTSLMYQVKESVGKMRRRKESHYNQQKPDKVAN